MSQTVVIIDDSRFILDKLVSFFVEKMGLEVVATGENGIEAIEAYRKFKPDLITMDITMPKMSGLDAIQQIKAEFPDAKIIVISAIRGTNILECMRAGALDFIEKPLRFEKKEFVAELIKTIEGYLVG
jgi:two-component system chemotaxis response regulator CheY